MSASRPSGPAWGGGGATSFQHDGRNLMLAVDLSGSMDAKDFELGNRRVDRLTATKAVASDFISRREGDRLGLILFGERAYLQVPLTLEDVLHPQHQVVAHDVADARRLDLRMDLQHAEVLEMRLHEVEEAEGAVAARRRQPDFF